MFWVEVCSAGCDSRLCSCLVCCCKNRGMGSSTYICVYCVYVGFLKGLRGQRRESAGWVVRMGLGGEGGDTSNTRLEGQGGAPWSSALTFCRLCSLQKGHILGFMRFSTEEREAKGVEF